MKHTHTLYRAPDPFATFVELTASVLTGRPFSPAPARYPTETEALRSAKSSGIARRSLLERFDEWALTFTRQFAEDRRPVASEAARARELRVLHRYY